MSHRPPQQQRHAVARVLAGLVIAIALVDLAGWCLGFVSWTRWIADLPRMMPTTALALALLGAGVASAARERAGSVSARWVTLALSAIAFLVAGWAVVAYGSGSSFGPERLFLYELTEDVPLYRGRMSPQAAGAIVCLALALALTVLAPPRRRAAQVLGTITAILAVLALGGHLHGVTKLFGVSRVVGVALPTAVGLLGLAGAIAALHEDFGVRALLSQHGPAARHARQLVLAAFVIPFGAALVLRAGEHLGWYDAGFRSGAYVGIMVVLLFGAAWATTRSLFRAEEESEKLAAERSARAAIEAISEDLRREITERERAEEAVGASEERFRVLVLASSDVVYRMSPDWAEMWHLVGRAFIADTDAPTTGWLQKYIPPGEQARVMAAIEDAIRSRRTFELEHRVVRADGTIGWTFSRAIPVLDARGAVTEWCGMASDVTARRRAEEALRESESFYRQTLESIPGMVFTTRPDGYCDYQSQQWVEYTGVPMSEHVGDGWNKLLHPEDRARAFARWQAAVQGTAPYDLEYRVRRKDGEYEWFRVIGRPIRDDAAELVRWFGVAMNIETLKRTEEALRDADRRKDEFLGMLSHELRNPLAPIRSSTYILQHAQPGSDQARRAQAVIQRQTEHLTRLVDDLLDVTRIARGKVELRRSRIDLREVVSRAADDFWLLLHDHGVQFRVELPESALPADADPTRVTQIIGNLLHNASKFTRKGDEVTLALGAHGRDATIRVRDTGAGIDSALLPRLFEPFVQGERTLARSEGGLGLGLAFVKGIAELHGGSVRAESAGNGLGAEFVVRLPLAALVPTQDAVSQRVPRVHAGRRVLVVDDNPDAAESLADVVGMLGHAVEVAFDGPSAVEKARAGRPDIVLCDIGLPGMSGYEVAKALREGGNGMQLFAVSGYAQPEDVKKAIAAGFDGHLAKPVNLEDVERLLA